MDKVNRYREIIRQTLTSLADFINQHWRQPQAEAHCVIDVEHDQYLLVKTGWTKTQRVRGTTLYLRLRDGKVWIEDDWTRGGDQQGLGRRRDSARRHRIGIPLARAALVDRGGRLNGIAGTSRLPPGPAPLEGNWFTRLLTGVALRVWHCLEPR